MIYESECPRGSDVLLPVELGCNIYIYIKTKKSKQKKKIVVNPKHLRRSSSRCTLIYNILRDIQLRRFRRKTADLHKETCGHMPCQVTVKGPQASYSNHSCKDHIARYGKLTVICHKPKNEVRVCRDEHRVTAQWVGVIKRLADIPSCTCAHAKSSRGSVRKNREVCRNGKTHIHGR